MISEWRRLWASFSPTSNLFPFGFMQLSTDQADDHWPGFATVRWHQTADFGYVPNTIMEVCIEISVISILSCNLVYLVDVN